MRELWEVGGEQAALDDVVPAELLERLRGDLDRIDPQALVDERSFWATEIRSMVPG